MLSLCCSCVAVESSPPAAEVQPAAKTAPVAAPKTPVAPRTPAKPAAPKSALHTEAEISGLTSETTDQFYTRLNLRKAGGPRTWYVRAGYGLTKTRTYSGTRTNETEVGTCTVDSQYRSDRKSDYRFVSAVANIRNRSPYSVAYGDKSGYYMVSVGSGRKLMPGIDIELSLADVATFDDVTDRKVTLVSSLRWTNNLTDAVSLTGHAYLVQPTSPNMLLDSRMDLTYKFSPAVSMRFSYVANNLLKPIQTRSGWDKSFRVSLVFSR